jgi:hypothetical protein
VTGGSVARAICAELGKQVPALSPGQVWLEVFGNAWVKVVRTYRDESFPHYDQVVVERPNGTTDTFGAAAFIGCERLTAP